MKKGFYLQILFVILIVSLIIALNLSKDNLILGLDNISPYFSIKSLLDKTFGSNGVQFFAYAPMLLLSPLFEFLKLLHIPLWIINQGYIFLCLILGVFGAGKLTLSITKKLKFDGDLGFVLGSIMYLASLLTFWIFNQPNYFFLASYASIPWLIDWVISILEGRDFKFNWLLLIRIFSLILFLQNTTNLVVTFSYSFSILLISILVSTPTKDTVRKLFIYIGSLVLALLLISQISLLISGSKQFVIINLIEHYSQIKENPLTIQISQDLRASGLKNNSLINNIIFKNSWIETHSENKGLLFDSLNYYNNIFILSIGLIPFSLSVFTLTFKNKTLQKAKYLHISILLGLVLMSSSILRLTQDIPFLFELFRWSASKFWPLTILPITILSTIAVIKINKQWVTIILTIISLIYIFPIFQGYLFSSQLEVIIPSEYYDLNNHLDKNKGYFYIPNPETSYFYTYKFGYFGSEFLTYMTRGDSYNTGLKSYFTNYSQYQELAKELEACSPKILDNSIIFDKNIINTNSEKYKTCLDSLFSKKEVIGNLTIYEK